MKKFEKFANMKGGNGEVLIESFIGESEFNGMGRLFAKVTLPKGSSIGYHVHEGDFETYYFLTGKGKYVAGKGDERVESVIGPGDVTHTPEGEGHSVENIGDEDLTYIALVLFSEQRKK